MLFWEKKPKVLKSNLINALTAFKLSIKLIFGKLRHYVLQKIPFLQVYSHQPAGESRIEAGVDESFTTFQFFSLLRNAFPTEMTPKTWLLDFLLLACGRSIRRAYSACHFLLLPAIQIA